MTVAKSSRQGTEHELAGEHGAIFDRDIGVSGGDSVLVHQGVGVEQVVAGLEEDVGQLGEESLEMGTDDLLILFVDQSEDDLTGLVGIGPLLHLDGVLDLSLAELKKVLLALGVVELDRVGDLGVEELVGVLLGLDELLEMVVESLSELSVFTLALEPGGEDEKSRGDLVVEMEKLGVLSEGLHDDLGDAGEEVDSWDKTVLIDDLVEVTVGEKEELLRGCVNLLSNVSLLGGFSALWAAFALTKDLGKLLNAIRLLDALDDAIALLDQVGDHGLQEAHAGVLADVSEVVQVVLKGLGGVVGHANVDQISLKAYLGVLANFIENDLP